jgi:antitoxin (DNA-binding transcriptional repressor) of toxin-antitoxin stability system
VEQLRLDESELGPRARALIDRILETRGEIAVTRRGRTLARIVAVADPPDEDGFAWDIESIAP